MRRGKAYEWVVAGLGLAAWIGGALWNASQEDYVFATLFALLGILSIFEIRRWREGQSALKVSSKKRAEAEQPAVPQTAWFAAGGTMGVLVLGLVWGIVDPARAASGLPDSELRVASAAAWIVPGFLVQWLLTRASDRRRETEDVPPPPAPI